MSVLTKKQVLDEFTNANEDDLFCVFCYEKLQIVTLDDGTEGLYCPNEHCDNDRQYSLTGHELN